MGMTSEIFLVVLPGQRVVVTGQVVRGSLDHIGGDRSIHEGCGGVVPPKPVCLHGIAFFEDVAIHIHDLDVHFDNLRIILRLHADGLPDGHYCPGLRYD